MPRHAQICPKLQEALGSRTALVLLKRPSTKQKHCRYIPVLQGFYAVFINYPIKCHGCPHIETSQVICTANQLTSFYMRATLAFNGLSGTLLI